MANVGTTVRRKIVRSVIGVYLAVSLLLFIHVSRVFGPLAAIELLLIPAFALVIAAPIGIRASYVRWSEVACFAVLMIVTAIAVTAILTSWYRTGMDRDYAEDLEDAQLNRLISRDPAFSAVELYVSPKHLFLMRGKVRSDADLRRLRTLASSCHHIRWNDTVEISGTKSDAAR
jgi:hypothetical protein